MIPQKNENTTTTSGDFKVSSFRISEKRVAHIFNMLSKQTYTDPIRAVMREYATNGWDAMIEAGTTESHRLEITLPTQLEPTFRVRDYGTGLSPEKVESVYISLGDSSKDESDDYNGMLGIGSKSGFSYAPTWQVVSYSDGLKTIYSMFVNDQNIPQCAVLASEETEEHNGVEIIIPVRREDIRTFVSTSYRIYPYFKVVPLVHNSDAPMELSKALFHGDGWRITGNYGASVAVMGNVAYAINYAQVIVTPTDDEKALGVKGDAMCQLLAQYGLEIDFEMGENGVEFAISREELLYSNFTKVNLTKRIESILDEVAVQVSESFKEKANLWEAKAHFNSVFSGMGHLGRSLSQILTGKVEWNGIPIKGDYFQVPSGKGVKIFFYKESWRRGGEVSRSGESNMITARPNTPVFINDLNKTVGAPGRIKELHNTKKFDGCYVLTFDNDAAKDEFYKEHNFDTVPTELLSILPKPAINKTTNAKHASKCFALNRTKGGSANSESWDNVEMDFEDGEGVYVPLYAFEVQNGSHYRLGPSSLKSILNNLEALGVTVPTIHGVKATHLEKNKLGDGWVDFFTWIKAELESVMQTQNVLQKAVNADALYRQYSNQLNWAEKYLAEISEDSIVAKTLKAVEEMKLSDGDAKTVASFNQIYQAMGHSLSNDKAPTYSISDMLKQVWQRYPLMQMVSMYHDTSHKAVVQYINAIDALDAK